MAYVANVGDSRAIISLRAGLIVKALTDDHKPSCEKEQIRIQQAGGSIY
jgi:protein phosphatase 2C family protein 2/3